MSHDQIDFQKPHSAAVKILSELDRQIRLGHESENSRTGSLLTSFQEEARLALLDRLGEEYPPLKESLHREFLKVQENFQNVDARTQAFQNLSLVQGFHLALRKPIQTRVEKYDSPLGYRLNYFESIQDSNQQNQSRALIQANLTPLTKDLLHFDYDTIYQRKQSDLDRVLSDFAKESILAPIISEAPPRAWEI
ncbi:MAG: hypothetical protein NTW61_07110 [Candidatus Melainabacteria bacterium]|nr:hypothetical protein [Candidatus Melainabacteria bacterium]